MLTVKDLKYTTKDGEEGMMPMWYLLRTKEELEAAKKIVINAEPIAFEESEFVIENREFTRSEFAEIEAMIACGYTFDAACQRQILKGRR